MTERVQISQIYSSVIEKNIFHDVVAMYSRVPFHHRSVEHDVAYIDGLVQDCSNSSANALELLQFCTKPSILLQSLR